MLQADFRPDCYIEVKSVTLAEKENGYFPTPNVTERGAKTSSGVDGRCGGRSSRVVVFAVLHSAITFSPARHIDIKYAQLLAESSRIRRGSFSL